MEITILTTLNFLGGVTNIHYFIGGSDVCLLRATINFITFSTFERKDFLLKYWPTAVLRVKFIFVLGGQIFSPESLLLSAAVAVAIVIQLSIFKELKQARWRGLHLFFPFPLRLHPPSCTA